eukprot:g9190.t1
MYGKLGGKEGFVSLLRVNHRITSKADTRSGSSGLAFCAIADTWSDAPESVKAGFEQMSDSINAREEEIFAERQQQRPNEDDQIESQAAVTVVKEAGQRDGGSEDEVSNCSTAGDYGDESMIESDIEDTRPLVPCMEKDDDSDSGDINHRKRVSYTKSDIEEYKRLVPYNMTYMESDSDGDIDMSSPAGDGETESVQSSLDGDSENELVVSSTARDREIDAMMFPPGNNINSTTDSDSEHQPIISSRATATGCGPTARKETCTARHASHPLVATAMAQAQEIDQPVEKRRASIFVPRMSRFSLNLHGAGNVRESTVGSVRLQARKEAVASRAKICKRQTAAELSFPEGNSGNRRGRDRSRASPAEPKTTARAARGKGGDTGAKPSTPKMSDTTWMARLISSMTIDGISRGDTDGRGPGGRGRNVQETDEVESNKDMWSFGCTRSDEARSGNEENVSCDDESEDSEGGGPVGADGAGVVRGDHAAGTEKNLTRQERYPRRGGRGGGGEAGVVGVDHAAGAGKRMTHKEKVWHAGRREEERSTIFGLALGKKTKINVLWEVDRRPGGTTEMLWLPATVDLIDMDTMPHVLGEPLWTIQYERHRTIPASMVWK